MYARNPLQEKRPPLSRKWLKTMLPKVGDRRMEVPTIDESQSMGYNMANRQAKPCVVVLVHPGHLWYMVQFENGIRESYKVPKYGGDRND